MATILYEYRPDWNSVKTGEYLHMKDIGTEKRSFYFKFRTGEDVIFYEDAVMDHSLLLEENTYVFLVAVTRVHNGFSHVSAIRPVYNTTHRRFIKTEDWSRWLNNHEEWRVVQQFHPREAELRKAIADLDKASQKAMDAVNKAMALDPWSIR